MKDNTHTLTVQEKRKEDAKRSRERSDELDKKHFSTPLPLSREYSPPEPYPFAALGKLAGELAQTIHEIVKAPDSICGHSVLSAIALITQPYGDIHIDGRVHPLSIFSLTAAESGSRKSAVDKIVLQPVRDYERMLANTYKEDKRNYNNRMDIWKNQRDAILKSSKTAGSEFELNQLPLEPIRPLDPYILLDEPTYEGLVKLFAIGQPSMGIFSDEGGLMLGGFSMGKDHMQKTACGLSSLWDGKPLSRIRGGDENMLLFGRRLSMHLMVQENILADFLKNHLLAGQGLVARCLIVAPSQCGSRPYNEIDIFKEPIVQEYFTRVSLILDEPFSLTNPNILNELSPRAIRLSCEAKKKWIQFHDEMDIAQGKQGVYSSIRRTVNKSAEHALRIAGVLTLFENIHSTEIPLEVIERAICLTRYYLNELLRITDIESSNPLMELVQATLDWMKSKVADGSFKVFTLQDIYQKAGPRGVRNKKSASEVMKILEEHEQVRQIGDKKPIWELIGC